MTSIFTFDPEMIFSPHFHFNAFPEKERERERARARERGEETEQSVDLQAAPISSPSFRRRRSTVRAPGGAISRRSPRRSRSRAVATSRSQIAIARSRRRELAPQIAISDRDRRREIAPSRGRDLRSIAISRRRELAPLIARSRRRDRDLRSRSLMVFFLGLCFPFSFPNTRKYFPENFLKCNQTRKNIFLFRKLAFPENMYFPENILRQPNTALESKI